MITVYMHGCETCGVNSVYLRRVKSYASDNDISIEIKNSKYDKQASEEHLKIISESLGVQGQYLSVVVDGDTVKKLRDWSA